MVLEAHEPLWSMGDDTPTPARARIDRTVGDHLRQSFAQVTNPAIDPERERIVMDLTVDLGRRTSLLGGRRGGARVIRLEGPSVAMALAVGASAAHPWLAIELARETAGSRGAEDLTPEDAVGNLMKALDAGLRKVLARMGISTAASYIGGCLFEVLDLAPDVLERCFPSAPAWPGAVGLADLAGRQLRRAVAAEAIAPDLPLNRMPDPGLTRFRKYGELHLYAPPIVGQIQG